MTAGTHTTTDVRAPRREATRTWGWLTPPRLHRATLVLLGGGLLASATLISGSG